MIAALTVTANDPAGELSDLYAWLIEEPDLRGRIELRSADIPDGALGSSTDLLQLILGSGGAAATAATVVIAWLKTRAGEVSVKLTRDTESLEVTAKGIKGLNATETKALAAQVAELLGRADEDRMPLKENP
ncbi:hypothetical protein GCM10022226_24000 [Sphaerisporangium flaviroseum]|uniref:Uncharacterized protein n=1 Tax=Sphaerisporangium flaviroseum TaxID=509199 RepID=A0ABP7HSL7_9ACTN